MNERKIMCGEMRGEQCTSCHQTRTIRLLGCQSFSGFGEIGGAIRNPLRALEQLVFDCRIVLISNGSILRGLEELLCGSAHSACAVDDLGYVSASIQQ